LATLIETINNLTTDIAGQQKSLDDALFSVQAWIDRNAKSMTEADRDNFSRALHTEKETPVVDGEKRSDDSSLAGSVLRLHAMRLLYRYDERQVGPIPPSDDNSAYGRAKDRLQRALRETEIAINEARVDTAIANAHHILADPRANHRWLQDALTRLQTVGARNLIGLADAIPAPQLPPLGLLQKVMFRVLGIKQEEIARRNLKSLREIAALQHSQLVEMAQLLAESFVAIGDQLAAQQALALLAKLSDA
jgi:hypothetical protein